MPTIASDRRPLCTDGLAFVASFAGGLLFADVLADQTLPRLAGFDLTRGAKMDRAQRLPSRSPGTGPLGRKRRWYPYWPQ